MMLACRIKQKIGQDWVGTTPGFHLRVILKGQDAADLRLGVNYPSYDWASLTKMVLTLTLFMKCVDEKLVHENEPVGKYLPELSMKPEIQIRHLLSHTAGLPSSIGFWRARPADPTQLTSEWRRQVLTLPMAPSERSSYSEIDFQILGYVCETVLGADVVSHWKKLSSTMGLLQTDFRPTLEKLTGSELIAPTEICPLRERRIQGEVHHPDIWLNGGVGWLSGLFGPMDDFARWAKGLRSSFYREEKSWVVSHETLRRYSVREKGSSSLGFMMPKLGRRDGQKYYLSSGQKLGPNSIGHTGFTGPMFWFDPDQDLVVLVLANRTFPTATNESWFNFRGILHDHIVESIQEEFGLLSERKEATQ